MPTIRDVSSESLRNFELFASLPASVLLKLAAFVQWSRVEKGRVFFHEGDPVDAIYLIRSGRVKVNTLTADGKEQLLNMLNPGVFFPYTGIFREAVHPATAQMDAPGVIGRFSKAEILQLTCTDREVAFALLGGMEQVILRLQTRIRTLSVHDMKGRLLKLREQQPVHSMTHQELANAIGAARETVSRVIADLRRSGQWPEQ